MNVQKLKSEESLFELEQAFIEKNLAILGILEVRRSIEKIIQLKSRSILCHTDSVGGQRGVGFLINRNWKDSIKEFLTISGRVAILKINMKDGKILTIVQIYAPTSTSSEEESEEFHQLISKILKQNKDTLLIISNFNGQIEKRKHEEEEILGRYNYKKKNPRGQRIIDFSLEMNLKIINTYFKK